MYASFIAPVNTGKLPVILMHYRVYRFTGIQICPVNRQPCLNGCFMSSGVFVAHNIFFVSKKQGTACEYVHILFVLSTFCSSVSFTHI